LIASEIKFYNFVWIKDLPMLYYSIILFHSRRWIDLIAPILLFMIWYWSDLISSRCKLYHWIYRRKIYHLYGIKSRVIYYKLK